MNAYAKAQAAWLAREYPTAGIRLDHVTSVTVEYEHEVHWSEDTIEGASLHFIVAHDDGRKAYVYMDVWEDHQIDLTRMVVEGLELMEVMT